MTSSAQLPPIELVVFDLGRVLVRICDDWLQACEAAGVKLQLANIDTATLTEMRSASHKVETNELTFDQLLFNRPIPGYAQYRGPVRGLYMCGSSTHPGGGVMGAPGLNASRVMLKTMRKA